MRRRDYSLAEWKKMWTRPAPSGCGHHAYAANWARVRCILPGGHLGDHDYGDVELFVPPHARVEEVPPRPRPAVLDIESDFF